MTQVKQCLSCNQSKIISEFYKELRGKYGVRSVCKLCCIERASNYQRSYKLKNPEKVTEARRRHYEKHKVELNKKNVGRYRKWKSKNLERAREYNRQYWKRRRKEDPIFKLKQYMRNRLNLALKYNKKLSSIEQTLGCTVEELKLYLESKFLPGMSWENWNRDGWHIDHVLPLSKFDLTKKEEFDQASHFSNLQPLWARDNLAKSDKVLV